MFKSDKLYVYTIPSLSSILIFQYRIFKYLKLVFQYRMDTKIQNAFARVEVSRINQAELSEQAK